MGFSDSGRLSVLCYKLNLKILSLSSVTIMCLYLEDFCIMLWWPKNLRRPNQYYKICHEIRQVTIDLC
jgi:hypothetical protein